MPSAEERSCPGLARLLERLLREDRKAEILDLGPLCGATVTYLAERGARVAVESFEPPAPAVAPATAGKPTQPPAARPPLRFEQPDGQFDLVLVWDHCDFTPPERLSDLGAELARVLAPGGWVLFFCRDGRAGIATEERRSRYRLKSDDRLVREPISGHERRRWVHATRELERALAPLSIEGIHLQRSGVREILAHKG